jgi:hypothetical protein
MLPINNHTFGDLRELQQKQFEQENYIKKMYLVVNSMKEDIKKQDLKMIEIEHKLELME